MKLSFLSLLLALALAAQGQPAVYQAFDVDTTAEPRGGLPYLTTFLQTNLRKPVEAEAKGLGGRVILSAIVEPDGRVTDVNVTQPLRPDLDREAVRVFSQFHAWRPAYKGGQAVRQAVTVPVTFRANTPFLFANGNRVSYYDAKQKPLPDSSELAEYKQLTPLSASGMPTGNVVILRRKGQSWKEQYLLPLARQKSERRSPAGKTLYRVGVRQADGNWQGRVIEEDESGTLVSQSFYTNGKQTGSTLDYHPNGIVAQRTDYVDTLLSMTAWYANGQIKQLWTAGNSRPMFTNVPDRLNAFWDSTGRQLVQNGTGAATFVNAVESMSDTTRQTQFIEQGTYAAGLKQGRWTGRYADGSYAYEEQYEKGVCRGGKSVSAGGDTIRYTTREQQPEFRGGMPGLGQFLSQNLHYPPDAQRSGVQGRVFISFVVCTDGTLCDYEVLKGVTPSVDQEAMRVVKAMSGRWKPGYVRGRAVRVKYNLPINFSLQ